MVVHLVVLVVAGAVVWAAGHRLSRLADQLAEATGVGRVLLGVLLLGGVTSLPEVATSVTAGVVGNPQLAIGNLMGGVALQILVIAVGDVVESRRGLTFQVSEPSVLVQHVALLLLLSMAIAGFALGEPLTLAGVGVWPVLITGAYLGTLAATRRAEHDEGWEVADGGPRLGRGAHAEGGEPGPGGRPSRPPVWRLVALSAAVLGAGWFVARAGDALTTEGPLSGTFVGAVLVAGTTSLPELSTVVGALRHGAYDMAVANIMGTNGLEVALLLAADLAYREGPIMEQATGGDIFVAALAAVLTCLYLGGHLLRGQGTVLRVGYDSAAVALTYVAGMVALATL